MRLHLIDGTYELYRAHFAPRPGHSAKAGWDAKATVGVVGSLLALLHDPAEAVTHLAVTFDNPIRSFRNDLFAEYKSDEGVPPELRSQFDAVESAVRALGVTVWSMQEFEADDGMASGAQRFFEQVEQVRIMSPDKDLGQCLRGERVVQIDRRQNKLTTEETFRNARGFGPASMPDFLALTGDAADGIPGIDGFGEKGAGMLIGAYQHLEHIPDDHNAWTVKPRGAATLAAAFVEGKARAYLYRELATLSTQAPISQDLEELRFAGVPRETFEAWCDELAAERLKSVPKRWKTP